MKSTQSHRIWQMALFTWLAAAVCFAAEKPASAPAASAGNGSTRIIDLINQTKKLAASIERETTPDTEAVIAEIDEILVTLLEIDQKMQAPPSHWTWKPIPRVPLEDEKDQEKFVIDPPIENGSAIAFQCRDGKVRIQSIKVVDANGISTIFTIEKMLEEKDRQREVRYLHYPTSISTLIVAYATEKDAKGRLNVWGGVTDLPEYAKEAMYWYRLARNDLLQGQTDKAPERLKQAAVKLYLFKLSRKIQ